MLTKAPPLLPLFTAASVWIYDSFLLSYLFKSRDLALIMPAVTVEFKLNGFPIASTHSPILAWSESPKFKRCWWIEFLMWVATKNSWF